MKGFVVKSNRLIRLLGGDILMVPTDVEEVEAVLATRYGQPAFATREEAEADLLRQKGEMEAEYQRIVNELKEEAE